MGEVRWDRVDGVIAVPMECSDVMRCDETAG